MKGTLAGLALAALVVSPAFGAVEPTDPAMRLLETSGFDAIVRVDATSDATLNEQLPESLPPELRAQLVSVLDRTLRYAETRRATAQEISKRVDRALIERHLRWWASSSGRAVAAAHTAAFRELVSPAMSGAASPNPGAASIARASPFATLLPELAGTSRGGRECLRMVVSFRRVCVTTKVLVPEAPQALLTNYSKLSAGDRAAFQSYLDSPGARDLMRSLGESYLQARQAGVAKARSSFDETVQRFARVKIGAESESGLRRVITLVDAGDQLEEARIILHLLRSVAPRDPRIPVELARVAIKQGPLVQQHHFRGDPPVIAQEFLDDAQSWMDHAIALEPRRADTLVLAGHLAYLQRQFPKGIVYLERARQIGTSNPWLALNLSDVLWAEGRSKDMDRGLIGRAARELETALAKGLPAEHRWRANYALAHIYEDLGDVAKGRGQFLRLISASRGYDKAQVWLEYSSFLFVAAGDVDGAIAAARESLEFGEVERVHLILAQMMLVKAGNLYERGQRADAAKIVQQARSENPQLARDYSSHAWLPKTRPAVFALLEAGVVRDLSDSEGGRTLLNACVNAGAVEIDRLIKWRADPNYHDPDEGTPLHVAIRAGNVDALRRLLAHGADATIRDQEGRLPIEMVAEREHDDPRVAQMGDMLRKATRGNPAAAPTGAPLRAGYKYLVLKRIHNDSYGHELAAGAQVTFTGFCSYSDERLACLKFKNPDPASRATVWDVALGKDELVNWQEWFKEIGVAAGR
jgi:tetratricopeptide (TPR) repeat protein